MSVDPIRFLQFIILKAEVKGHLVVTRCGKWLLALLGKSELDSCKSKKVQNFWYCHVSILHKLGNRKKT